MFKLESILTIDVHIRSRREPSECGSLLLRYDLLAAFRSPLLHTCLSLLTASIHKNLYRSEPASQRCLRGIRVWCTRARKWPRCLPPIACYLDLCAIMIPYRRWCYKSIREHDPDQGKVGHVTWPTFNTCPNRQLTLHRRRGHYGKGQRPGKAMALHPTQGRQPALACPWGVSPSRV